jgi:hypothetical protein
MFCCSFKNGRPAKQVPGLAARGLIFKVFGHYRWWEGDSGGCIHAAT